ncbi:hypothetical protein A3Q37_01657 [Streptomyces sp. PTY087I2]|nr:hypothetical protein A3Q37_01657 [Streptomyces sp. PTY087I2]
MHGVFDREGLRGAVFVGEDAEVELPHGQKPLGFPNGEVALSAQSVLQAVTYDWVCFQGEYLGFKLGLGCCCLCWYQVHCWGVDYCG